ncbi:MAG: hypothetical protein D6818_06745 [Bacteroidetes bacterium]|nr:MAG: hypothetical protein D6818_06745 [Bacteroidota bacterium]
MAVQIDRSRIDRVFLTKSVMPLFNATTAAGISDWPFYTISRRPASFRIWFSLSDPHLIGLLRPAIEEHFQLWLDSELQQKELRLHYGQPHELLGEESETRDVAVRMLHLVSGTCLKCLHYYRHEWNEQLALQMALQMQMILLKSFTPLDTEAVCLLEQLFRNEVRTRTPDWKEMSRMQRIERIAEWRCQLYERKQRAHHLLLKQASWLWAQPSPPVPPPLERFATIAPVLIRSFKEALPAAARQDPDEGLPSPASWQPLHHFFRHIHNNLLLEEEAALLDFALIPQAIQQATSRMS